MEQNNLFLKLKERLQLEKHLAGSTLKKVCKNLCVMALAGSMLFTTGCQDKNNNQTNNQNNNQTNNGENNVHSSIAKYSQALQNVLTNEYYSDLIYWAKLDQNFSRYGFRTANKYQAIPYGFLEDEGFDIEAIKNDSLKCETELYTLSSNKNELYIVCRVENKGSINYYTHYLIKYQLTDKELSDLNFTHKEYEDGSNTSRTVSFQAPFFIQEISNLKEPEVIFKTHMDKASEETAEEVIETYAKNLSKIDMSKFSKNNIGVTYAHEYHEGDETSRVYSQTLLIYNNATQSTSVIQNKTIAYITLTGLAKCDTIDGKQVFVLNSFPKNIKYVDEFENSKKVATFYNTYNSGFIDMLGPRYRDTYGIDDDFADTIFEKYQN